MGGLVNVGMGKLSVGHIGDGSRANAAYLFLFKLMTLEKIILKSLLLIAVYITYICPEGF